MWEGRVAIKRIDRKRSSDEKIQAEVELLQQVRRLRDFALRALVVVRPIALAQRGTPVAWIVIYMYMNMSTRLPLLVPRRRVGVVCLIACANVCPRV